MKTINLEQLQFKQQVDPKGLLNPGKMRAWWERGEIGRWGDKGDKEDE
jgi:hypothetical protein